MKYIASCSFGKDSLAMVLKLLELQYPLDEVVFYNSGAEFQAISRNKDKLALELKKRGIVFTELLPSTDFFYAMLKKPVNKKNGNIAYGYKWCGGVCRWGTRFKIDAIKENNKKYKDEYIVEYIGIALDEPERLLKGKRDATEKRTKSFPLVTWEMTEKDCLEYCYSKGYNWEENGVELYSILNRVSCWCCRNKNLKELKNMYQFLPDYWNKLKDLQSKIDMPFYKNKLSIFELEERFKKELNKS